MEYEHSISENAKLESLRKHFNKDLRMGRININGIQNKFEELTATIKTTGAHVMLVKPRLTPVVRKLNSQFLATHFIGMTGKKVVEALWL